MFKSGMLSSRRTFSVSANDLESNTRYLAESLAKDSTGEWTNGADNEFTTNSMNSRSSPRRTVWFGVLIVLFDWFHSVERTDRITLLAGTPMPLSPFRLRGNGSSSGAFGGRPFGVRGVGVS